MKRLLSLAVVLAFVAAACGGDDDTPTSPSPAAPPRFTAQLTAAAEAPVPVTNADSSANGTATITLNVTRDAANNITAATADFVVSATGFPAGTTVTAAHIHPGAAGVAGGVLVGAFGTGEFVVSATGAGSITKTAITVTATDAQAIINNPAGFYFNVHTALNPGGAIRGQLTRSN